MDTSKDIESVKHHYQLQWSLVEAQFDPFVCDFESKEDASSAKQRQMTMLLKSYEILLSVSWIRDSPNQESSFEIHIS